MISSEGARLLEEVTAKVEEEYKARTPKSAAVMTEARKYLPGGDTRRSIFFFPYPIWIDHADGCHVYDEDGNDYLDFHNCYTTMILGHGNPDVKAAIGRQLDEGTMALGAFKKLIVEWAQIMCDRVESVDQVRFTCTGSESVMMALRAARVWTGRNKIVMEYGGYHGAYDAVVFPPESKGLPADLMKDTILVPYNDKDALQRTLDQHKGEVAALILEGLMGAAGMIPAKNDYLKFAREITSKHEIVFILDEIISFRLDPGGVQRMEGIEPDLTTFGKIMAGGTAMACFGGRRDLMQLYSPENQVLHHAGTLNANPLSAAAGVAQLKQITPDLISRLNGLGESLASGMRDVFRKAEIKGQVTGMGSLCNVHFGPVAIEDGYTARDTTNKDVLHLFHLSLINHGILTPERAMFCMSAPMTEKEVHAVVRAVEEIVHDLKPYITKVWPDLVGVV